MLALTVRQPFATLIVEGVKSLEYRKRPIRFRGRIAIHAAAQLAPDALLRWAHATYCPDQPEYDFLRWCLSLPLAAVIGTVEVYGFRTVSPNEGVPAGWPYAWKLTLAERLPDPIPARGALNLWRWNPAA